MGAGGIGPADQRLHDGVGHSAGYLKLRPHERANFSVVILNADSENLPLAMANGLARRIEDDPEIRCELVVTDDDTERLRQVYERQNRRISHEIDTSLASEAARNFLSRLRVGIFSPDTLTSESGLKANDVVLLQDVISRSSRVRWTRGEIPDARMTLDAYVPTSRSKRRPFKKGNTTSALYLTAPRQPAAGRAYVDSLRAVATRDAVRHSEPWLPVQEVEFRRLSHHRGWPLSRVQPRAGRRVRTHAQAARRGPTSGEPEASGPMGVCSPRYGRCASKPNGFGGDTAAGGPRWLA